MTFLSLLCQCSGRHVPSFVWASTLLLQGRDWQVVQDLTYSTGRLHPKGQCGFISLWNKEVWRKACKICCVFIVSGKLTYVANTLQRCNITIGQIGMLVNKITDVHIQNKMSLSSYVRSKSWCYWFSWIDFKLSCRKLKSNENPPEFHELHLVNMEISFERIAMKFGAGVCVPWRMDCNNVGDPLTFHQTT